MAKTIPRDARACNNVIGTYMHGLLLPKTPPSAISLSKLP